MKKGVCLPHPVQYGAQSGILEVVGYHAEWSSESGTQY